MAGAKTGARRRVMITGLAQTERERIARALEEGGVQVVPSAPAAGELVAVLETERPDAVVLPTDLLAKTGKGTIRAIRAAAPATKIFVVTKTAAKETAAVPGADGYLEAGTEPAAISAAVIDLVNEPTIVLPEAGPAPRQREPQGVPAKTEVAAPIVIPEARAPRPRRDRRLLASRIMLVAGIAVIAITLLLSALSGDEATTAEGPTEPDTGGQVLEPPAAAVSALDEAYGMLDDLVAALEAGRFIEARVDAELLMQQRAAALDAGFSLLAIDAEITTALQPFAGDLGRSFCTTLTAILGDLMPACSTEPAGTGGGGGSGLLLGGGTSTGGGTQTGGGGTGGGGDGGGGAGGGGGAETFPGKGSHVGWEHKPPKGGWHGKPPGR